MNIASASQRLIPGNRAFQLSMLVLKACLFLPLPLLSQTRSVASATIPFAFSAGRQVMPAGTYVLSRVTANIYALRQQNGDAAQQMVVYASYSRKASDEGKLVFHNYGSEYFLSAFQFAGSQDGVRMIQSKAEKETIAAAPPAASSDVIVAMNSGTAQ